MKNRVVHIISILLVLALLCTLFACDGTVAAKTPAKGSLTYGIVQPRSLGAPVEKISIDYSIFYRGKLLKEDNGNGVGFRHLQGVKPGEYKIVANYKISYGKDNNKSVYTGTNSCVVEAGKATVCTVKLETPEAVNLSFTITGVDVAARDKYAMKLTTPDGKTSYDVSFRYFSEIGVLASSDYIPQGSYKVDITTPKGTVEDSITLSYSYDYHIALNKEGQLVDTFDHMDFFKAYSPEYFVQTDYKGRFEMGGRIDLNFSHATAPCYIYSDGNLITTENLNCHPGFLYSLTAEDFKKIGLGRHKMNFIFFEGEKAVALSMVLNVLEPYMPAVNRVQTAPYMTYLNPVNYEYRLSDADIAAGWTLEAHVGFLNCVSEYENGVMTFNDTIWNYQQDSPQGEIKAEIRMFRYGLEYYKMPFSANYMPSASVSVEDTFARLGTDDTIHVSVYYSFEPKDWEYRLFIKKADGGELQHLHTYRYEEPDFIYKPYIGVEPGIYELYGGYVSVHDFSAVPAGLKFIDKVRVAE